VDTKTSGALGGAAQGAATGFMVGGPWGAVIGAGIGGLAGLMGGGGEDEAKKLARRQVVLMRAQAKEQRRRDVAERDRSLGTARAAIAASNVQMSGSSARYVKAMEQEYGRQLSYNDAVANMRESLIKAGGDMAAEQIKSAGISNMIGGFGSALSTAAGAGAFSRTAGGSTHTDYTNAGNSWLKGEGII